MAACFAVCAVLVFRCSGRARRLLAGAGDDETFQKADDLLGDAMSAASTDIPVGIVLFTLALSNVRSVGTPAGLFTVAGTLAFFLASELAAVYYQARLVKQIKAADPAKRGNALDARFEKDWIASSDEAEKLIIYRSAYSAFRRGQKMYPVAAVLLLLVNLALPTGVLPALTVGILWLAETVAYQRSCRRLSREKIS